MGAKALAYSFTSGNRVVLHRRKLKPKKEPIASITPHTTTTVPNPLMVRITASRIACMVSRRRTSYVKDNRYEVPSQDCGSQEWAAVLRFQEICRNRTFACRPITTRAVLTKGVAAQHAESI
jgi:hypothetical protein